MLKHLDKINSNKIKIAVTDIDGILRGKYIHKQKFDDVLDNSFGFCDVIMGWDNTDTVYNNSEITGWHTGFPRYSSIYRQGFIQASALARGTCHSF